MNQRISMIENEINNIKKQKNNQYDNKYSETTGVKIVPDITKYITNKEMEFVVKCWYDVIFATNTATSYYKLNKIIEDLYDKKSILSINSSTLYNDSSLLPINIDIRKLISWGIFIPIVCKINIKGEIQKDFTVDKESFLNIIGTSNNLRKMKRKIKNIENERNKNDDLMYSNYETMLRTFYRPDIIICLSDIQKIESCVNNDTDYVMLYPYRIFREFGLPKEITINYTETNGFSINGDITIKPTGYVCFPAECGPCTTDAFKAITNIYNIDLTEEPTEILGNIADILQNQFGTI